nr:RNA-directed DNA polymerase, eukaryota, reverse transcriptase zinc-binding domain protein [Tanacetum cinerariifolium]
MRLDLNRREWEPNLILRVLMNFNDFIHSSGLIDLPSVGKRFTRMDNLGSKHSKIDCFLVSHHVINKWPNSHVIALPREFSNHTPPILLNTTHDFGPTPFRLYNSWMDHPEFADPIQASWASSSVGLQPAVGFKYVPLLTPAEVETRTSSIKFLADMENRKEGNHSRRVFSSNLFKQLSVEESHFLDCPITLEEIKRAVWDCGSSKAPGPSSKAPGPDDFELSAHIPRGCNSSFITLVPKVYDPLVIGDFRPISLIGKQYKITAKILANCLSQVVSSVVSEVQMAYIKGRQIIDGLLMVDEIIAWAKKHKKRLMYFKVDFEKAFDFLNWSFLFSILEQMGFSFKWRNWIHYCLNSAFASVLVNGSPTKEFKIKRGKEKIHVSHLQFTDDALIIGDWSRTNAKNLSRILKCFHLASDLKVNFNKSKLYEVGVTNSELSSMASTIGCLASQFPFIYLGLPIGAKMSRCHNWKPLVDRFHKRLSKWKSKSLSFGGRLTLVRSILGSLGVYYFSNFKAPKKDKFISLKVKEGLSIQSISACNQAMLSKWRWRIKTEDQAIWCRLICSIHGPNGGLHDNSSFKPNFGPWLSTRTNLGLRGMDFDSVRCAVCDEEIETEEHVFVHCKIAVDIWKDIFKWWKIPILHKQPL